MAELVELRDNRVLVKWNGVRHELMHPSRVYWFYDLSNGSNDKGYVATTTYNDVIWFWALKTQAQSIELKGHTDRITKIFRIGKRLVSASFDGKVIVWTLEHPFTFKVLYVGQKGFLDISLTNNTNTIAIHNEEPTILYYNLQTNIVSRHRLSIPETDNDLFHYLYASSSIIPTRDGGASVKSNAKMFYKLEHMTQEERTKQLDELDKNEQELAKEEWNEVNRPTWYKTEKQLFDFVKQENKNHSSMF